MDESNTHDGVVKTTRVVTWNLSGDAITTNAVSEPDTPVKPVHDSEDADKINNNTVCVEQVPIIHMDHNSQECSECGSADSANPVQFITTGRKELLTSFSRNLGGDLCSHNHQPCSIHVNSKVGGVFGRMSSWTEENLSGFNLPSFIVAGIASNLKLLGVEEIDCKEHVEAWLSQRRQRRWKQSLGCQALSLLRMECAADSHSCTQCFQKPGGRHSATELSSSITNERSETLTDFSPSQPNSSLLRLTGDGNVKLGQFLQKMEEVRGHFNNASCTLLQSTVLLTLPYMKLLSGNQLDDLCCRNFAEEWIFIVTMMAENLKSESMKEVDRMLCREYRTLRAESTKLYKRLKKMYRKIYKIYEENEHDAKPAMQRLQPKRLPRFRGRPGTDRKGPTDKSQNPAPAGVNTTLEERQPAPPPPPRDMLQLSPVPLARANLTIVDLYKDHIFFTKSKKGHLVFKNNFQDEWKRFAELSFNNRRELFLHVVDDLHNTLKLGTTIAGHVKELFIEGYPESVCTKIRENLKYLKQVSKDEDLLMLSKVTIANQVKALHESLARLVETLKNLKSIAKSFSTSVKLSPYMGSGGPLWKRKTQNQFNSNSSGSSALTRDWEFEVNLALRFDNYRVKLLVPYPNSSNPFIDQF